MNSRLELSNYIDKKYGSIYTKNGSGKYQVGGTKVTDFAKKILGNRVLDVYLKYTALKTLTSATMVPVAFILGKEYLQKVMNQSGGGDPIPSNIPLLDHPLVGTYLKVLGLSALDITTGSLLPLGALMIMHDLYTDNNSQIGGSINNKQTAKFNKYIEKRYGNIYSKNGRGKSQVGGKRVTDFAKKILGNRVLDVYLKYTALKTLTSATMVPVAFILGKEYLQKVMNQSGGGDPIPSNIPLLDHPLVGTYLKILGLSALDLTTGTLLPLGSLMIIHDLYAGSDSQTGGSRSFIGSSVPPNSAQQIGSIARGQGLVENTIANRFPNHNNQMQLACNTGNCSPNVFTSYKDVTPQRVHVDAFPTQGIKNSYSRATWSGDLGIYKRAVTPVSMAGGGSNYQYITNPNNGKVYNINSKEGKGVLNNYLKTLK